MPRARLSAYKSSITNRGPQSGGSVGGNDKAGLINMWNFVGVTQSTVSSRLPGACCLDVPLGPKRPAPSGGPGSPKPAGSMQGVQVPFYDKK